MKKIFAVMIIFLFSAVSGYCQDEVDCTKSFFTTLDVIECMTNDLVQMEETMEKYQTVIKSKFPDESELIDKSQEVWLEYRKSHCDAVFKFWITGSIRHPARISCLIELTHQRTKTLWSSFLDLPSSDPPLPDPGEYKPKTY